MHSQQILMMSPKSSYPFATLSAQDEFMSIPVLIAPSCANLHSVLSSVITHDQEKVGIVSLDDRSGIKARCS